MIYLNKQINKRNLAQDHKISQVCNTNVTVLGLLSATKTYQNAAAVQYFFVPSICFFFTQFFSQQSWRPNSLAVPAHLHSTPAQRSEVWRSNCSHLLANDLPSGRHFRKGRSQSTCDRISGIWAVVQFGMEVLAKSGWKVHGNGKRGRVCWCSSMSTNQQKAFGNQHPALCAKWIPSL